MMSRIMLLSPLFIGISNVLGTITQYYKNFFGAFIGHCLSERYYEFLTVHPKIASVLYAADRFESKEKIEDWLKKGYVVLANRYVSANQIHQGGKIADDTEREALNRLSQEGLVRADNGRGFRVAPISQSDLRDLLFMRQEVESLAIKRANVVLPTPGGPQRIIECGLCDSNARRRGLPGPSR